MPAIYNGGKYYGGFPTKTSQLQNDAQFASINDSTKSLLSTLSSKKILDDVVPKMTIQTTEPSEVAENEFVFVVEE